MYDMSKLKTDQSLIRIVAVDDVKAACNKLRVNEGLKPFTYNVEACSVWPKDGSFKSCTVYIGKKTNNDILGHEIRHCFQGNFH
jgi:cation transport regulator ChaC